MGRVVLVTGVADPLGVATAGRLARDPTVERVVGVDTSPPPEDPAERPLAKPASVRFVRADIRHPVIASLLDVEAVDTVLHMGVGQPTGSGGSAGAAKEAHVIGTMQLLAACQRAPGVRQLVLRSSTAVYGASSRAPGLFTEDTPPEPLPGSGYAKDCSEVEGYVRGFGRRRRDVALTVLRLADVLGGSVDSPLARHLGLPVVPTVLGFDPRLQLLHVDDAVHLLHRATVDELPGTFNVAGDGVLTLAQAVRRLGRPTLPVPGFGLGATSRALRRTAGLELPPDQVAFLTYGRVVDTAALRERFGHRVRWSTAQTLDDFAATAGRGPLTADRVRSVEEGLVAGLADLCHTDKEAAGG